MSVVTIEYDFLAGSGSDLWKLVQDAVQVQKIRILVNNVGMNKTEPFDTQKIETLQKILTLNCSPLLELTHQFVSSNTRNTAKKLILNMSSVTGLLPTPYVTAYTTSKGYILDFSEELASSLPRHLNIAILVALPWEVSTQMINHQKGLSSITPLECVRGILAQIDHSQPLKLTFGHPKHQLVC